MPTTIDHPVSIETSNKDNRAPEESPVASASVAISDECNQPGSDKAYRPEDDGAIRDDEHGRPTSCRSSQANSCGNHQCVTLPRVCFFTAIRLNSVIESYCKSWDVEPAWMPRVCGLCLDARMGDGFGEPYSEALLTTVLNEAGLSSAPRSAVLSNAQYICRYLVPPGMPYMITMSPTFGLAICTPFYSTIPSAFPDIPDALFSLRNLTIDRVIGNLVFRHEFAFNNHLKVEVPSQLHEAISSQPFWKQLEYETEQVLRNSVARAPTPIIPIFLNETKKLLLGIMPCALGPHLLYHFDTDRLLDGALFADPRTLNDFLAFVYSVVDAFVLPLRKAAVREIKDHFSRAVDSPESLVAGFRIVILLLNQTKIDLINAQVRERRAMLSETVIPVEMAFYRSVMAERRHLRADASRWLMRQPTISDLCRMCKVPMAVITEESASPAFSKASRFFAGFVWSVLRRCGGHRVPSPMLILDKYRIRVIQQQMRAHILHRLKTDVASRYPENYSCVACSPRIERSPLYLLIEKRVLGSLAVRLFKDFVGASQFVPASSQPQQQLLLSENKVDAREGALTRELSTLLTLHWRAASFLYDDPDADDTCA